MLTRHVSRQLARYCDGQVAAGEARRIDAHLAVCARCRQEHDDIRFAAGIVRQLAGVAAPAPIWDAIDAQLGAQASSARLDPGPTRRWMLAPALGLAWVLAIVAAGVAAYWMANGSVDQPWEVATLRPATAPSTGRLAEGAWVETDMTTRARITVGRIGTVDVEPATRVRLGATGENQYRLAGSRLFRSLFQTPVCARIMPPP